MTPVRTILCVLLACAGVTVVHGQEFPVPDWLYPISPPAPGLATSSSHDQTLLHVPGSDVALTFAQVTDMFAPPDWFPDSHPRMPGIVAKGRRPDLYACGYCHLPDGAGRPENVTLAGLPARYIVDQVAAFASGARRSPGLGSQYRPATRMVQVAGLATPEEVAEAAAYFSSLSLRRPRAEIIETTRVPQTHVEAWLHVKTDGGGDEPLGTRLIEVPQSFARHEWRDPNAPYVAYVPTGSLERGRKLVIEGTPTVPACVSCHGAGLHGGEIAPPIAGRSPTYLLRQLVAFRTRARAAPAGAAMQPVVDALTLEDMIAAAAFSASLEP